MKQSIRCCKLAALSQALAALSQSATFAWLWLAPMREGHNVRALGATTVRPARGGHFQRTTTQLAKGLCSEGLKNARGSPRAQHDLLTMFALYVL